MLGVLTLVSVDVNLTVFPTLRRQFPAELRYGYSKYCLARRTDIGVSRCQLDSFPHITLGFRSGTAPITTTEKTTGTSRHGNIANICSNLCVCVCVRVQAAAKEIHRQCNSRKSKTLIKPALCYGRCQLDPNTRHKTYVERIRKGNIKKNGWVKARVKGNWLRRRPGEYSLSLHTPEYRG